MTETEPFNDKFNQAGFENSNYLIGIGSLVVIVIGYNTLLVFKAFVRFGTKSMGNNWLTRKVRY